MSKIILHFTNLDTFATEIAEDDMDDFYMEWADFTSKEKTE